MNTPPPFLSISLRQLELITIEAYSVQIAPIALALWRKHLRPGNPQWKYITAQPFFVKDKDGSAHVLAMIDSRLPDIGLVGYFACTNAETGSKALLGAAEWLRKQGKHDVYGPINGTLPSDYRLNLQSDFCFPGEPVNPQVSIDAFKAANFSVFNRYVSGIAKHYQALMKLTIRKPAKKYAHLTTRQFEEAEHKRDFKIYHELRNKIFPSQSLYCPAISLEERIYNFSGKFDPRYTYFLLDNGREVGFVMGYAYKNQLVLKTIGLLTGYRGKRLSGLLLKPVHDQAAEEGLEAVIYGLVRVGNAAYKMQKPGVKLFRHYITMHKAL